MNEPAEAAVPGRSALESLWSTFEDFGLAGPAARVLCALLQEGSAGASQLAARAGVARTNVYPVLDSLVAGGVAMRVPGPSRVWTTPGWSAVIERLYEAEADRLEMLRSQRDAALALVEELSPEVLSDPLPFVHVLHNAAETRQAYAQLFARSTAEVVVCDKAPYANAPGETYPEVLEAVARGVRVRALYEVDAVRDPTGAALRAEHDVYDQAGVVGRVVDAIALKMGVFDRRTSLVPLAHPTAPDVGFPTILVIEQPDLATVLTAWFEQLWSQSRPYDEAFHDLERT